MDAHGLLIGGDAAVSGIGHPEATRRLRDLLDDGNAAGVVGGLVAREGLTMAHLAPELASLRGNIDRALEIKRVSPFSEIHGSKVR